MSSTISIKNWDRLQHYGNRPNPPWVKLYRDILSSEAWVMGSDTSRLLQVAIILLAARYQNAIPNNFSLLKKVTSFDFTEGQFKKALEHLSEQNFVEIQHMEQSASSVLATRYPRLEESRGEEIRVEERIQDLSGKPDSVLEVFEHWKISWGHPRASLDLKRTAVIKKALKGYSAADLCASISGYRNSPHHTGQNERQTVYDALELFLRDSQHIDAGLRFAQTPQALTSELANHNVRVLQEWRPPELRNATPGYGEISDDDGVPSGGVRKAALAGPH